MVFSEGNQRTVLRRPRGTTERRARDPGGKSLDGESRISSGSNDGSEPSFPVASSRRESAFNKREVTESKGVEGVVVSLPGSFKNRRGVDLTLKLKSAIDEPIFFINYGDNRIIKCVDTKENLEGAAVSSREKRLDADVIGIVGPTSTKTAPSGTRKSRRDRNLVKEENDLTNFEVREIMERSLSSRESSIGRAAPSRSRSRSGSGCMSESTEERSHAEDGSRSEEVSLQSGGRRSREGSGKRSREGSGKWTTGMGRSSGNNSQGSRKSYQSESERRNSSEKQEIDEIYGTTSGDGVSNSVSLKGDHATSPSQMRGGKVRYTNKAQIPLPLIGVRSAAMVSSSAVAVDRFYDITSIMAGRGVFRVGGGGSFKREVTKTSKEEDSYIGGDDDDENLSVAESISMDSSAAASANVSGATGQQVEQQTACVGSKASINTSSSSIDHSSNINNNIFSGFDRHSSSAVTATLTLRESRIITSDVVSGGGDETWGQFMASDWFSKVLDSGVGAAPLEYDDDDSSVVMDAGNGSKGGGLFKSAVRSCFCTPWRVPAAHM